MADNPVKAALKKAHDVTVAAGELDRRRQAQVENQKRIIDRLLGGDPWDHGLPEELARLQVENEDLKARVRALEAPVALDNPLPRLSGGTVPAPTPAAYGLGKGKAKKP